MAKILGSGNDTYFDGDGFLGLFKDAEVYGNAGNDTIYGNNGDDTLHGGSGNDKLFGGNDRDRLYGDSGNDSLSGGACNDYLNGGTGSDTLKGGMGNDTIYGGDGNDIVSGGSGIDKMYGGAGTDRFTFTDGEGRGDRVMDYNDADDYFDLRGTSANSMSDVRIINTVVDGHVAAFVDYGTGSFYVMDVTANELNSGDFIF